MFGIWGSSWSTITINRINSHSLSPRDIRNNWFSESGMGISSPIIYSKYSEKYIVNRTSPFHFLTSSVLHIHSFCSFPQWDRKRDVFRLPFFFFLQFKFISWMFVRTFSSQYFVKFHTHPRFFRYKARNTRLLQHRRVSNSSTPLSRRFPQFAFHSVRVSTPNHLFCSTCTHIQIWVNCDTGKLSVRNERRKT